MAKNDEGINNWTKTEGLKLKVQQKSFCRTCI